MSVLILLANPAHAGLDGAALCNDLDAAEELCESRYGDDDALCAAIGAVDETCDPEDGGAPCTDAGCAAFCGAVDGVDDDCDDRLGEADAICAGLDAIADDACETYFGDDADDDADGDGDGEEDDATSASARRIGPTSDPAADGAVPAGCSTIAGTSLVGAVGLAGLLVVGRRFLRG